jgi:hypothetical protein
MGRSICRTCHWMNGAEKLRGLTVATLCVFGTQAGRLFLRTTFYGSIRSFAFTFHGVRARVSR